MVRMCTNRYYTDFCQRFKEQIGGLSFKLIQCKAAGEERPNCGEIDEQRQEEKMENLDNTCESCKKDCGQER